MSRTSNFEAWQKAEPLSGAWKTFAPLRKQEELASLSDFHGTLREEFERPMDKSEPLLRAILKPLQVAQTKNGSRNDLIDTMRESLLDELYNNQLFGLGRRKRPSRSSYPVLIDSDFFDGADINWDHSTAENFNLLYVDIRVSKVPVAAKASQIKGSGDLINRAIRELIVEHSNFCSLPRKTACDLIREKLNRKPVKGSGFSDPNLCKMILDFCPRRAIQS